MKFNITEPMARAILDGAPRFHTPTPLILHPLYARIGVVFPHLKAEYSYLDWDKFKESEK